MQLIPKHENMNANFNGGFFQHKKKILHFRTLY